MHRFNRRHALRVSAGIAALAATAAVVAGCGTNSDSNTSQGGMNMPGMTSPNQMTSTTTTMRGSTSSKGSAGAMDMENVGTVSGMSSHADGYTMMSTTMMVPAGQKKVFRFRIMGQNGKPVTMFGLDQSKRMHLIVASKDLAHYQHVHPTMAADGTWSVPLTLPVAGSYRAYSDFNAGGKRHVLGMTLTAPGTAEAQPLPTPTTKATTDGYVVTMHSGTLKAGKSSTVRFTVTKNGQPVTDLQPYLGTLGHLVVLQEGTLEYLHVHPTTTGGSGPDITFDVDLKAAGDYRAFLQFQTNGKVHTVAYTLRVA